MRKTERCQTYFGIFVLFAVGCYLAMQSSLMPLARVGTISTDTGVWLQLAREMSRGRMVYRDLFDHKGPLLFLLYSVFFRAGGITGVWILQCIFLAVTAGAGFLCAGKLTSSPVAAAYAVMSAVLGISIYGGEDFSIEEMALPFVMISLYIFVSYFCDADRKIRKKEIFLLGACMGSVLCLRQNMIALWAVFILAVVLELLFQKRYADLLSCIGCFTAGFLIILLAVAGWLWYNGALQACWEDSVLFNFLYVGSPGLSAHLRVLKKFFFHPLQLCCVCLNIFLLITGKDKRVLYGANLLYVFLNLTMASMSGAEYPNYEIALIPGFLIPFAGGLDCLWKSLEKGKNRWRLLEPFWIISLGLFLVLGNGGGFHGLKRIVNNVRISEEERQRMEIMEYIKQNTLEEEKIAVLGNNAYIYLGADRDCATEFIYTSPVCRISGDLEARFMEQMETAQPPMIVVMKEGFDELSGYEGKIKELLDEKYQSALEAGELVVYEKVKEFSAEQI